MAFYEQIPIAKYSIWIQRHNGEPSRKSIILSPDDSYSGLVKIIRVRFHDDLSPNYIGFLRPGTPGEIGGGIDDPPINGIDAYAPDNDFTDFYHILQTEKPCYWYYYLDGGVEIPSTPVTSEITLGEWVLMTSIAPSPYLDTGEPIGEGPADLCKPLG